MNAHRRHQGPAHHREAGPGPREVPPVLVHRRQEGHQARRGPRGGDAVQGHRRGRSHQHHPRQDQARRQVDRQAAQLQEGGRHPEGGRQDRALRGRRGLAHGADRLRNHHGHQEIQADLRRPPSDDGVRLRGHHQGHAGEEAHRVACKRSGGRNVHGHITRRHQGGGHKRRYRVIDFKRRDKDGVPAKVASVEYDPNRTANIALLHYADGEKRYILAPVGLSGRRHRCIAGETADIRPGNCLPLQNIPVGTVIHNVELKPGRGAQIIRSAGSSGQLMAKEGELRPGPPALGRSAQGAHRVPRHRGPARQHRARDHPHRQGRQEPLAGHPPHRPRSGDEPGRPPARWW